MQPRPARSACGAIVLLLPLLSLCTVTAAAADEDVRALAASARASLAARIEPPIARLPFNCIARRTPTAPMREYILDQQAAAVDALVAAARAPGEGRRIRRFLNELRRDSYARDAGVYLAERHPGAALESGAQDAVAPVKRAAATQRYAAFVQALAGCAFGLAAAWLLLRADDTEPSVIRLAIMSWTWGWPTVLASGLIYSDARMAICDIDAGEATAVNELMRLATALRGRKLVLQGQAQALFSAG